MDFRVKTTFRDDLRIKRLHRALGADGVLALLTLWAYTAEHHPKGVLRGMDQMDMAEAARYTNGDPAMFYEVLFNCGFVERIENNQVIALKDWSTEQRWAFNAPERSAAARAKADRKWELERAKRNAPGMQPAETASSSADGNALGNAGSTKNDAVGSADGSAVCNAPFPLPLPLPLPSPSPLPAQRNADCIAPSMNDGKKTLGFNEVVGVRWLLFCLHLITKHKWSVDDTLECVAVGIEHKIESFSAMGMFLARCIDSSNGSIKDVRQPVKYAIGWQLSNAGDPHKNTRGAAMELMASAQTKFIPKPPEIRSVEALRQFLEAKIKKGNAA